jgi:hypothetical protein
MKTGDMKQVTFVCTSPHECVHSGGGHVFCTAPARRRKNEGSESETHLALELIHSPRQTGITSSLVAALARRRHPAFLTSATRSTTRTDVKGGHRKRVKRLELLEPSHSPGLLE